jgi:membrane protease YdiL (CAAX protease family)
MNAGWLVGALATGAIVWLNAGDLALPVRLWTTALLAALPLLVLAQARQIEALEALPRREAYLSTIASLWLLAGLTALFAWWGGLGLADVGLVMLPPAPFLVWTGVLTVAGMVVILGFHAAGFRESRLVRGLIPETPAEQRLFLGVSATAGVCEEFVFRGFLFPALLVAAGSVPMALLVSSAVFGLMHAYQQPAGALRAALLGAVLAAPLIVHGSILPAIAAHAFIDVIAGLWLSRYLLRD